MHLVRFSEAHVYATERAGLLYSRGGAGHTRGFSIFDSRRRESDTLRHAFHARGYDEP